MVFFYAKNEAIRLAHHRKFHTTVEILGKIEKVGAVTGSDSVRSTGNVRNIRGFRAEVEATDISFSRRSKK